MNKVLRVGIVGTGYAARLRAFAFAQDPRSQVVVVAGQDGDRTQGIAQAHRAEAMADWRQVAEREDVDLVVVATINALHAPIVRAALEAGKPVVVEYPLALSYAEGQSLLSLAQTQGVMLHVEHIEQLGGLHQAFLAYLPRVGRVEGVHYTTLAAKTPPPRRWSYHLPSLGFPLIAALSRIHRLTHALGPVAQVSCQGQLWPSEAKDYFTSCYYEAQLEFVSGVRGEVTYGKGEVITQDERRLWVVGDRGELRFEGERGELRSADGSEAIAVTPRRGLFALDTAMVLGHLLEGSRLYVSPKESLYALRVAEAAQESVRLGRAVEVGIGV